MKELQGIESILSSEIQTNQIPAGPKKRASQELSQLLAEEGKKERKKHLAIYKHLQRDNPLDTAMDG